MTRDDIPNAFLCWRILDSQKLELYLSFSLCPVFSVSSHNRTAQQNSPLMGFFSCKVLVILVNSYFEVCLDFVDCLTQAFSRAKLFFVSLVLCFHFMHLGFFVGLLGYTSQQVLELGLGQHLCRRALMFRSLLLNHAITLFQVALFFSGCPFKVVWVWGGEFHLPRELAVSCCVQQHSSAWSAFALGLNIEPQQYEV